MPGHTCTDALTSRGFALDQSPAAFGELRPSEPWSTEWTELSLRLESDGYLYLPGFYSRVLVAEVRHALCQRMAAEGMLTPGTATNQAVAPPNLSGLRADMGSSKADDKLAECTEIQELLYGEVTEGFFVIY